MPRADLERAVRDVVPELLPGIETSARTGDVRNSLLTLARIWYTLATGGIESKDVAAAWAIERLPAGTGVGLRLALAATSARPAGHVGRAGARGRPDRLGRRFAAI